VSWSPQSNPWKSAASVAPRCWQCRRKLDSDSSQAGRLLCADCALRRLSADTVTERPALSFIKGLLMGVLFIVCAAAEAILAQGGAA
jgi:DNA-directed RNA polymerase subunit RPC12/RpoP